MDLESWREVHKALTEAVIVGKEAVAAATAQRRYWLEEICASLTSEGKLAPNAVWKKATKKGGPKRKAPKAVSKRKKSEDTETDEEVAPAKKAKVARKPKKVAPKKVKLKLKARKPAVEIEEEDDEDAATASVSAYSTHEHEAAAALSAVANTGDMSHIPEELRAFMAPQEYASSMAEPDMSHMAHETNPYAAKGLRPYDDDEDDDEDDDDDDDDLDGFDD